MKLSTEKELKIVETKGEVKKFIRSRPANPGLTIFFFIGADPLRAACSDT